MIPVPEGLSYKKYQEDGILYARNRQGVLIADEPGLGKTVQAIGISNDVRWIRKVLIIAPSALLYNWKREWEKWCVKGLSVEISTPKEPVYSDVTIISYHCIEKLREFIDSQSWDLLICDEAHNLKNEKSDRALMVLGGERIIKTMVDGVFKKEIITYDKIRARKRVFLTGTPILNRPVELWTLLHSLAPQVFDNYYKFGITYCDGQKNRFGWDFSGASNVDTLRHVMRDACVIRRLKKEVLTELPEKVRQIILIQKSGMKSSGNFFGNNLSPEHETQLLEAWFSHDQRRYNEIASKLKKARIEFERFSASRLTCALKKIPFVIDLVNLTMEEGKIILFAHHQQVIEAYRKAFGNKAVVVDGSTDSKDIMKNVDRFQHDPECRVFIGSILASGVGLTLTASSHVIFAEIHPVPGIMSQAEDRAHRMGQKNSVLVWHVVIDQTTDARMVELLLEKQKVISSLMDTPIDVRNRVRRIEEKPSLRMSDYELYYRNANTLLMPAFKRHHGFHSLQNKAVA